VLVAWVTAVLLALWLGLFAAYLAAGGDPEVVDYQLGHDHAEQQ
jgi:hypothetical protein